MRENWMYRTLSKPMTLLGAPKSVIYIAVLVAPVGGALLGNLIYMFGIILVVWLAGVIFGNHDPEFLDLYLVKVWKLKPPRKIGDRKTTRYEP